MLSVAANSDGLPLIEGHLSGIAAYLDNFAIIDLAKGPVGRRQRFLAALERRGSLLFSFTNAMELSGPMGASATAVRDFLDEVGARWLPVELNPWEVAEREVNHSSSSTPAFSPQLVSTYFKQRVYDLSPNSSDLLDLSPESFFQLGAVVEWAGKERDAIQESSRQIDAMLIERISELAALEERDPRLFDREVPPVAFNQERPATFALHGLLRQLATEAKSYRLKKGDGLDFCHAVVSAAYASFTTLDKHWKRRIKALPEPHELARVYGANELDNLVDEFDQ